RLLAVAGAVRRLLPRAGLPALLDAPPTPRLGLPLALPPRPPLGGADVVLHQQPLPPRRSAPGVRADPATVQTAQRQPGRDPGLHGARSGEGVLAARQPALARRLGQLPGQLAGAALVAPRGRGPGDALELRLVPVGVGPALRHLLLAA